MNFDSKKYTAEDIKVPSMNEFVMLKPEMYWGTSSPKESDGVQGLIDQLKIFECEEIQSHNERGWYFVSSSTDWFKFTTPSPVTLYDLFQKQMGFPEGGPLGLRMEYFLFIMAEDIFVFRNDELITIKGNIDLELEMVKELMSGKVGIGFRGNRYLDKNEKT